MSSDSLLEELNLFIAHFHGTQLHEVEIRGLVPGENPRGYAKLLKSAMERAWRERGNRPLPPGYE